MLPTHHDELGHFEEAKRSFRGDVVARYLVLQAIRQTYAARLKEEAHCSVCIMPASTDATATSGKSTHSGVVTNNRHLVGSCQFAATVEAGSLHEGRKALHMHVYLAGCAFVDCRGSYVVTHWTLGLQGQSIIPISIIPSMEAMQDGK